MNKKYTSNNNKEKKIELKSTELIFNEIVINNDDFIRSRSE